VPRGWREGIEPRVNRLRRCFPGLDTEWHIWRRYPMVGKPPFRLLGGDKSVDFCRGPAEMADAIRDKRPFRFSPELRWHTTQLVERMQYPEQFAGRPMLESTFAAIEPFPDQC